MYIYMLLLNLVQAPHFVIYATLRLIAYNDRLPGVLLRARRVQPDRQGFLFATERLTGKIYDVIMLGSPAETCTNANEPFICQAVGLRNYTK